MLQRPLLIRIDILNLVPAVRVYLCIRPPNWAAEFEAGQVWREAGDCEQPLEADVGLQDVQEFKLAIFSARG